MYDVYRSASPERGTMDVLTDYHRGQQATCTKSALEGSPAGAVNGQIEV